MLQSGLATGYTESRRRTQPRKRHAAELLLEQHRAAMLRYARRICGDRATAEDVLQISMLRAWRNASSLRNPAAIQAWLATIVRREAARMLASSSYTTVSIDCVQEAELVVSPSVNEADLADLRARIAALPSIYREPLIMQVVFGCSVDEISQRLNIKIGTVLSRLSRARDSLREAYKGASTS